MITASSRPTSLAPALGAAPLLLAIELLRLSRPAVAAVGMSDSEELRDKRLADPTPVEGEGRAGLPARFAAESEVAA